MIDYEEIEGTPYGLPQWLVDKLNGEPDGYPDQIYGEWLPSVINALAHFIEDYGEMETIIREFMPRDPRSDSEIPDSIRRILKGKDLSGDGGYFPPTVKTTVTYNPGLLAKIEERSYGLRDLRSESDKIPSNREALESLFPGDETLVCFGGWSEKDGIKTYPWQQTEPMWLIGVMDLSLVAQVVPNAMTKEFGRTKSGKRSARCLDNAAYFRRWLVMDFDLKLGQYGGVFDPILRDAPGKELMAGVIRWLQERSDFPLKMVVDTGGGTLHAWWYVWEHTLTDQNNFFNLAAPLGADPAIPKNNSQFVRMPGGTREVTGARQHILFWRENL